MRVWLLLLYFAERERERFMPTSTFAAFAASTNTGAGEGGITAPQADTEGTGIVVMHCARGGGGGHERRM